MPGLKFPKLTFPPKASGRRRRAPTKKPLVIHASLYFSLGLTLEDNYFLFRINRVSLRSLLSATTIIEELAKKGVQVGKLVPAGVLDATLGPVAGEKHAWAYYSANPDSTEIDMGKEGKIEIPFGFGFSGELNVDGMRTAAHFNMDLNEFKLVAGLKFPKLRFNDASGSPLISLCKTKDCSGNYRPTSYLQVTLTP